MQPLTDRKIVLVVRRTRLDELVTRFNTVAQARFYIEHLGADFSDYETEHRVYHEALATTQRQLRQFGRLQVLDRQFLPNFIFGPQDTVVVLGQDGLVANTLKYLDQQPLLGVNPDPKRWDGVLLPFTPTTLHHGLRQVFFAAVPVYQAVTLACARLNDGQVLYAVNDLFIGLKSHASARYTLRQGDREERQSSSGIIVSTGLGATGWLSSLLAGAHGIINALYPEAAIPAQAPASAMPWDAEYLCYTVREPFPSRASSTTQVFGKITAEQPLFLVSHMPEQGVIFSDGIESDFIAFNAGTQATLSVADKCGYLVMNSA